ncbi:response regulator [Mucilaginibacter lappiensis]|uniref:DNA-binding response OmpR family regulator n=1 Tax=Mucilaginibacter lappiensis TaxID=354630 RepID=A0A1N6PFU0_9SPHI|nr:response regulator [Mucilaginibacter lappiensis]MBB6107599.1 DNA-binding response OmpR family regulator [Mucilaginibacter lappiensis]MBB6126081.1 DNA-binding response OmpR family regulator [Mucilaginibacter lappiensis]SIQ03223.1 two-component system, OmpR family, response regulator RpaA [Mucilaginibacter lappiensis]
MKRVLILDNDPGVLDVMQEALSYEGFDVVGVEEANNLDALIADYQPHLLMMDFALNGTDGGKLCQQLKTNAKTSRLPIIIISAYSNKGFVPGSYGCNDFITKPFDLYDLIARIKVLVGQVIEKPMGFGERPDAM